MAADSELASRCDIELFVQQALWAAPRLPDPSRLGVLSWTTQFLRPEDGELLADRLRLHHPVQIAAEEALGRLLERVSLTDHSRAYLRGCRPGRAVDWPATLVASHPIIPHVYLSRTTARPVDGETRCALATLARTWASFLRADQPVLKARREALLASARLVGVRRTQRSPISAGTRSG